VTDSERRWKILILDSTSRYVSYDMGVNVARALKAQANCDVTSFKYKPYFDIGGASRTLTKLKKLLSDSELVIWCADADYEFEIHQLHQAIGDKNFVIFFGDDELNFSKHNVYYAQIADLVLTASPMGVSRYKLYGIDSKLYYSSYAPIDLLDDLAGPYERDLAFVGGVKNKVGREVYIEHLARLFDLQIFGAGTRNGIISRSQMEKIFRTTKINLSFTGVSIIGSHSSFPAIESRCKQIKGRCQEILLAGGFVLTEYVPGLEEIFEIGPGKHLDVFHNADELIEKINYYLIHERVRRETASCGHRYAVGKFNEVIHWGELLGDLTKISRRSEDYRLVFLDPIFKRGRSSFFLIRFLDFLLQGKLSQCLECFRIWVRYPYLDLDVLRIEIKRFVLRRPRLKKIIGKVKRVKNIVVDS